MINRPRFRSHLYVEIVPPDRVFLVTEGRHFTLSGRSVAAAAALIDGRRTSDEIVVRLIADGSTPTDAYLALLTLEKHGHLEEEYLPGLDLPDLPLGTMAFWDALGVEPPVAAERLAARTVAVVQVGRVAVDDARLALRELRVQLAREIDSADLWLVMVDDGLRRELAELNRQALASGRSWLLARPNGLFPWVGPMFEPGRTGCWECLAQRLRANSEVETYLAGLDDAAERAVPFPPRAALPAVTESVVRLAALEIARRIVISSSAVSGRVTTLDTITLQTQVHELVRRPQCPACGDPRLMRDRPAKVELASRPKAHVADGGHRSASPGEMLRRYGYHVSPITGIAKALVRITDPADPVQHVYLAGSNMAVRHDSFQRLRRHLRSSCCGKGTTDEQARASGLGEAIERYCGVFRGDEARIRGSLSSLGDQAIDPRACMLYSETQYRERDRWNALQRRLDGIPMPLDADADIEWSPLWSLTVAEQRYLPTSYLYYSYPSPPDRSFCFPDSNGNAAGATIEDAILQGFLELVERDAVAVWWYNRLRRPAVDLDTVDEQFVRDMVALHRRLGRDLWVLDLTGDLEIPAMIAISRLVDPPAGRGEDIVFAPAAHLDPRVCLLRSLTELNQMMPGIEPGPDGTGYIYDDPEAVRWWSTATLANQPYLVPSAAPPVSMATYPERWNADLRDDITACQALVESRGLELLVLDQTRPDVEMPVVKVVVPGMRHFWARYAPGRLYDVPVAMGWLERPTPEDQLNPVTLFI
jgi:ribosomal protein S12 methylthiotransferase accessory factor